MKRRFVIAAALFAASLALTPGARASDALIGALLGAGAGIVVGHAVGGQDGAIVGGGIGAIAGAAIGSHHHRSRAVYAPVRRSAYYDEPVIVERRHVRRVEHDSHWEDHHPGHRPWRGRHEYRADRYGYDD
jgi:hypothetical protein